MNYFRSFALFGALVALTGSALAAPTPVGSWKGKVTMTLDPNAPANVKQQYPMIQAMLEKISINMVFKADKTFTITNSGGPQGGPAKTESGTWTQSGLNVSITNPKSKQGPKSQTAVLSANGKTMTLSPSTPGGPKVKVVFTKA